MQESSNPQQIAKKAAAIAALAYVKQNMIIGLGTGSTAFFFIEALAKKCQEGLIIQAVASSDNSYRLAQSLNIPLIDVSKVDQVDLTVDGADEIDLQLNMIKGGGGALLREKLLAKSSKQMIAIVDNSKVVKRIGAFPVALEIVPFLYRHTISHLKQMNYAGTMRLNGEKQLFKTDNGNFIFDIHYAHPIENLEKEDKTLKAVTGVVETGFFYNIASLGIIGKSDGTIEDLIKR